MLIDLTRLKIGLIEIVLEKERGYGISIYFNKIQYFNSKKVAFTVNNYIKYNPYFSFIKEFLTYTCLLSYYGAIIGLTKYESCKIDLLKTMIKPEYASVLTSLSGLVFMPLGIFSLLLIRPYLNVYNLFFPSLNFNISYIGLLFMIQLLEKHQYYTFSFMIYSLIIKPILNILYFYCIADVYQSYNYELSSFYKLVISALSQVIASFYKDIAVSMLSKGGYSIYDPMRILAFINLCLYGLQIVFKSDGGYKPELNESNSTINRAITKRMFSNPLILSVIVYTFAFVCLQEVNECIKVEALSVKINNIEAFKKYSSLFELKELKIRPLKPVENKQYGPSVIYNYCTKFINKYIIERKGNKAEGLQLVPYAWTVDLEKTELVPENEGRNVFSLVHKREIQIDSLFSLALQLFSFIVLLYNFFDNAHEQTMLSTVFIAVSYLQLALGLKMNLNNILLTTMLFNSIDTGFKKSIKDLPYGVFSFETKNYIKMYLEYAIEPLARIIGGIFGYLVRRMIHEKNGLTIAHLNELYILYNLISAIWFGSTLLIIYYLYDQVKENKKTGTELSIL